MRVEPTGWFEEPYSQARRGDATVPWDSGTPHAPLIDRAKDRDGAGRRALVGCGLGRDSESFATGDLTPHDIVRDGSRWRAEFHRS